MKHLMIATCAACLMTAPIYAQETPSEPDGFSLMEEGAKLLFRGLMTEMEPTLDELTGLADEMRPALEAFADEMGPAILKLVDLMDEITHYEMPEILPNGDIIIRRSPDAPAYVPPEVDGETIEL